MKMLLISLISFGTFTAAHAMPMPIATSEVLTCTINGNQFVKIDEGELNSASALLTFGSNAPIQVEMTKSFSESQRNYFHPYFEISLTEVGSALSDEYEGIYYSEQQKPKSIECVVKREPTASSFFPTGGACCSWLNDKRGCFKVC